MVLANEKVLLVNSDQSASNASPESLSELLEHFVESTEGQEHTTVGDLLDSLNSRSHGPMLLFPAVIAISPIGMIPGMSIVTGSLIILIATQMMIFSSRPWIPKRLSDFEFRREKLKSGSKKIKGWVQWFEKFVYQRCEFLTTGVAVYPVAIICILLGASFYPLAFVPFGVFVPGLAITLFALGMTARDGILVLLGFGSTIGVATTIWLAWPF